MSDLSNKLKEVFDKHFEVYSKTAIEAAKLSEQANSRAIANKGKADGAQELWNAIQPIITSGPVEDNVSSIKTTEAKGSSKKKTTKKKVATKKPAGDSAPSK